MPALLVDDGFLAHLKFPSEYGASIIAAATVYPDTQPSLTEDILAVQNVENGIWSCFPLTG